MKDFNRFYSNNLFISYRILIRAFMLSSSLVQIEIVLLSILIKSDLLDDFMQF